MRHPEKGKTVKNMGRQRFQLEAFSFQNFSLILIIHLLKTAHKTQRTAFSPYLHEKTHPSEDKTHLLPYFKMITANLR